MYNILYNLLSDKKGGEIFTCFGVWHIPYIAGAAVCAIILLLIFRKKSPETKGKLLTVLADISLGMYALDFFLMPIAYGSIDIEKLPFHVCTSMCVCCFLSRHFKPFRRFGIHFTLLGFLSNLIYLIYPAGVMWHAVGPFSYRVIQTLSFHAVMTVYGLLSIIFENDKIRLRNLPKDLLTVSGMSLWALIGNTLYNGSNGEGYDHFFNWFFVKQDPFGMIDKSIAPYVMPFIMAGLFFALEVVIHLIVAACRAVAKRKNRP